MKKRVSLAFDIGGTWLKGAVFECNKWDKTLNTHKVRSNLSENASVERFINAFEELLPLLITQDMEVYSAGISTAGVVNYAGTAVVYTAPHLSPLKDKRWYEWLKERLGIPVVLLNDADATTIGAAYGGYLQGYQTIGIMPIGTGLGFTVWRNGRRWNPHFSYTLLGCIATPQGSYDQLASVVSLARKHPEQDLMALLQDEKYREDVDNYLTNLVRIIQSSYYMYHTTRILIGGGLADAAIAARFPLTEKINTLLQKTPLVDGTIQEVELLAEGNRLPLLGAVLNGYGEIQAQSHIQKKEYHSIETEKAYAPYLHLEKTKTKTLVKLFWQTEQEAGMQLKKSLKEITEVADRIVESLQKGGRLIYVGAGTSGRLAAIDTVELACTFGFPRDRVLTFIAGSVADAGFDIESHYEEDASSIPEMLMASINEKDIVIGISVSGTAYYVLSALAYATHTGAYSVLIQEGVNNELTFCNKIIPLNSGYEVIAGSTRMKAGTATKKVLNFLSTTTMIRLERVYGSYMTYMECTNNKLLMRAQKILKSLYSIPPEEATELLQQYSWSLPQVIKYLSNKRKK